MKLLKPGERVKLELQGSGGDLIVYWLRAPSVYDRVEYRRAVAARGGRYHTVFELLAALRREVDAAMAGTDRPETQASLIALIDVRQARLRAFAERTWDRANEEGQRAYIEAFAQAAAPDPVLLEVEAKIRAMGGLYAAMIADNDVYFDLAGLEAARLFVVEWEGLDGFAHGRRGLTEAALQRIPTVHLPAIAAKVEDLFAPAESERKNSVSPSPMP